MTRWPVIALAALATSCGTGRNDQSTPQDSTSAVVSSDSLVVSGPGGVEIWYTHSRAGKRADGSECLDRAIEIRRGDKRIPVPLLYTGETPRIVNDSTARAILYTGCRAGDAYLVDLRNGRPTREHR